jgi:preprotein translocase subunit SecE
VNFYVKLGLVAAVVAGLFAFLWAKGYLLRLSNYVGETREELKKCTWPTWDELKGSTAVVLISMLLLGVFTIGIDFVITLFVRGVIQ